uniref:MADF domain-containing protein n=1 Tax=Stomoxys calcitrans TaxID=35570 RepID=A0A1I8PXA7_STOCA
MNNFTTERNNFTLERNNCRRKLILMVKQHPILWNKTQENYNRNRPLKMHTWKQISEVLGISVEKIRRTWENLRDQYRRDLKREMKYGFKSKWRFFKDMDFIREMVTCKGQVNELTDSDSENENNEVQQYSNYSFENIANMPEATQMPNTIPVTNSNNFQPIILTKQWQSGNNMHDEAHPQEDFSFPTSPNANSPFHRISQEIPLHSQMYADVTAKNFNSARDMTNPPEMAKKEADSDVEIEAEYMIPQMDLQSKQNVSLNSRPKQYAALTPSRSNVGFHQEPLVTTTNLQRPKVVIEASCSSNTMLKNNPSADIVNPMELIALLAKREPQTDSDVEIEAETLRTPKTTPSTPSHASTMARQHQQEAQVSTSGIKRPVITVEDASPLEAPACSSATNRRKKSNESADLEAKDEDYYFVMSLLPSIRQIPRNRKFALRIGIMNLIAKDLEEVCK